MTGFTIGVMARRSGCKVETIRYYERIGLMPAVARSAGGHRLYEAAHLRRLSFIRRCRELGFPLEAVRDLLGLIDGGDFACAEVKALTIAHAGEVRERIADLTRMERVLSDLAAQCDGGDVPDCAVIDALFQDRAG